MKRHRNYKEMQQQMMQLEKDMHQGDEEYDALYKALRDDGNPDKPIIKTMYWFWLVEHGYDMPEAFFYSTPPIGEAAESNRILLTGTKVETRGLYSILHGLEAYKRVIEELRERQKKLPSNHQDTLSSSGSIFGSELACMTKPLAKYKVSTKPVFSASVGSFWEQFFGEDRFLDNPDKVSIPRAIIGTGCMRNYNRYGGETLVVKERLEEIAKGWDIPIEFINSWAP